MTVTVTGRVVDEHGAALPISPSRRAGIGCSQQSSLPATRPIIQAVFTLKVPEIPGVAEAPSSFRIRVLDVTRRQLTRDRGLAGRFRAMTLATSRFNALF